MRLQGVHDNTVGATRLAVTDLVSRSNVYFTVKVKFNVYRLSDPNGCATTRWPERISFPAPNLSISVSK